MIFSNYFLLSALVGSAASSCVQRPLEKIVPYVEQPIDTVPGVAKYYNTTCKECPASCGVQVKTKDGRPIKLEGIEKHPVNTGKLCAIGQASIQGLYHPERLKNPQINSATKSATLTDYKDAVQRAAQLFEKTNKKVAILTGATSGTSVKFYHQFLEHLGSSKDHLYRIDPRQGWYSLSKAHRLYFNASGIPRLQLSKADYIVGFNADFLDTGISPVFHARGFSTSNSYLDLGSDKSKKGYFVQFESNLSLTGSKADKRFTSTINSEFLLMLFLLEAIIHSNSPLKGSDQDLKVAKKIIQTNAQMLANVKTTITSQKFTTQLNYIQQQLTSSLLNSKSVVLTGDCSGVSEHSTQMQLVAIVINRLIGAYNEKILDFEQGWIPEVVGEDDLTRFISQSSQIGMLIVINYDPVQSIAKSWNIDKTLKSIDGVLSLQTFPRSVDHLADIAIPVSHYLESWGDSEPFAGFLSLQQPAVRALYHTAQSEDVLLSIAAYLNKPMGFSSYV